MIIVAGHLIVDPGSRREYLDGSKAVVLAARGAPGCLDFSLAADIVSDDRINIYERWESVEAVEAFRGDGPSGEQMDAIRHADVEQFDVSGSTSLT